jgi:hypothetical protein
LTAVNFRVFVMYISVLLSYPQGCVKTFETLRDRGI